MSVENYSSKSNGNSILLYLRFSLAKKLQRHTNANRQLVFDVFAARTNICASLLVTRARLLLLNDYEPMMNVSSLNDLKEKLKVEVQKSLETHIQSHNQAVKSVETKSP